MDLQSPIVLSGSNLKDRRRYLNSLVNRTIKENVSFEYICAIPESSAVDRIFKLEVASKCRNVEYIIKSLMDDDMLYVSKSLKCLWLLEPQYCNIINPLYLEDNLYPEMIRPAVNKMKCWIRLHLKDPERCQSFYEYYKADFHDAFSYFWRCSNEFIMSEFPNVLDKLSPKQLKIVLGVCPSACKCYFELLPNNRTAITKYENKPDEYFKAIKIIMKRDSDLFLDIVEEYFNVNTFARFGPAVTHFIMKYCRSRFNAKSELYTAFFLDMKTLATSLTSDQAKDLILRLARAEYLGSWFSYKTVEPLIKRLRSDERRCLKTQVFVDKSIDCKVKEWPYPMPQPLRLVVEEQDLLFTDVVHEPHEYVDHYYRAGGRSRRRLITKRMCRKKCKIVSTGRSPLDQLFNRYRFIGFEQTFDELSKKLLAENKIDGRLNMMLVLVSKSGGVTEQVEKLLKLMVERHRNETSTLRAAVARSLVKRACVWRLPENVWQLFLEFGRDIGLDGTEIEPFCREGLHAVVLHNLLTERTISNPKLLAGFIKNFSTFSEYKLYPEEIKIVAKHLPTLILPIDAHAFVDTLIQYKINIDDITDAKRTLLEAAKSDSGLATELYKAKLLRRELFSKTFEIAQSDVAYINALRYDSSLLENGKKFAELVSKDCANHDRFLKSLYIYFGEAGSLAEQHRMCLEVSFLKDPNISFTSPLCSLMSPEQLIALLLKYESERPQTKQQFIMSTGLRTSAHKAKPPLDIHALDWRWLGAKAIANKAFICRSNDQKRCIKKLLEWRRTARISVRISLMTPLSVETFIAFSAMRPFAALKLALSVHLTRNYIEPSIWNVVRAIIENNDLSKKQRLLWKLSEPTHISKIILADYLVVVYKTFMRIDEKLAIPILSRLENILPDVDSNFVRGVVKQFIDTKLVPNMFCNKEDNDYNSNQINCLYVRIIAKHLLLCKSEQMQAEVVEDVCDPFFDAIEVLLQTPETELNFIEVFRDFMMSLKYSAVFLSKQYVSCLPVFEKILIRMPKILPIEKHFDKYVEIQLTMLYYNSVIQANKLKAGIFDECREQNATIEIVGRMFGKYIGHEIKELVAKFFKSIVDLYKITLDKYIEAYFQSGNRRNLLVTSMINGLLEANTTEALILAEFLFQKEQTYHVTEPHRAEILNTLKKCSEEEVKFLLHADVAVSC